MYGNRSARLLALAIGLGFAASACDQPSSPHEPDMAPQRSSSGPVIVECPSDYTFANEGQLGSVGGEIGLAKHKLSLPALAVVGLHNFRLEESASKFMELTVNANGQESFAFRKPVTITLDYSRCTRSNIDHASLSVWKIDPVTKQLLKHMGGVDDPIARTVTFTTDSLSTYVIAD